MQTSQLMATKPLRKQGSCITYLQQTYGDVDPGGKALEGLLGSSPASLEMAKKRLEGDYLEVNL